MGCNCPDTLAPCHATLAVREGGAVAADAVYRKQRNIPTLRDHITYFVTAAIETVGVNGPEAKFQKTRTTCCSSQQRSTHSSVPSADTSCCNIAWNASFGFVGGLGLMLSFSYLYILYEPKYWAIAAMVCFRLCVSILCMCNNVDCWIVCIG